MVYRKYIFSITVLTMAASSRQKKDMPAMSLPLSLLTVLFFTIPRPPTCGVDSRASSPKCLLGWVFCLRSHILILYALNQELLKYLRSSWLNALLSVLIFYFDATVISFFTEPLKVILTRTTFIIDVGRLLQIRKGKLVLLVPVSEMRKRHSSSSDSSKRGMINHDFKLCIRYKTISICG